MPAFTAVMRASTTRLYGTPPKRMPTRLTMPTGAPLRKAFTQTLMNEKISAKITRAKMPPMMKRTVMRFMSSDLGDDEAEIIEARHAQLRPARGVATLAKRFVTAPVDVHVATGRER